LEFNFDELFVQRLLQQVHSNYNLLIHVWILVGELKSISILKETVYFFCVLK